jgi:hypothetical protein
LDRTKADAPKIEFKCPKCGASPNGCPKKPKISCMSHGSCLGFICECTKEGPEHGASFTDVCREANCYHCGWGGTFPVKPKGLQAWEKKALDAGWSPPDARSKELGLVGK